MNPFLNCFEVLSFFVQFDGISTNTMQSSKKY